MSNPIVSFDEQAVKDELRELVRKTIEETINAILDEEADQLVGAGPYERTDKRAARCTSTATRWPRSPNPSVPGSRPYSRRSTRWNRAKPRRPRPSR